MMAQPMMAQPYNGAPQQQQYMPPPGYEGSTDPYDASKG